MTVTTIAGHEVHVDAEGFLTDVRRVGRGSGRCARRADRPRADRGALDAIRFLRQDFREKGETATLRRVSTVGGIPTKQLFELFPKKPAKKMAYVAGLPKPHGCV